MNKNTILYVKNMVCERCIRVVREELEKIEGVDNVNVNLATEEVTFNLSGESADLQKVAEVVEESGYKLNLPAKSTNKETASLEDEEKASHQTRPYLDLKQELIKSTVLALPIMLLSMLMMWLLKQ